MITAVIPRRIRMEAMRDEGVLRCCDVDSEEGNTARAER
jgi:hypothetical protein